MSGKNGNAIMSGKKERQDNRVYKIAERLKNDKQKNYFYL